LSERREDIPLLSDHFIGRMRKKTGKPIKGLSQSALRAFLDHPWPGNIRELENAIEHAFVLCNSNDIDIDDLPIEIREPDRSVLCAPVQALPSANRIRRPKLTKQ